MYLILKIGRTEIEHQSTEFLHASAQFGDEVARWGEFEELQDFCQEHKIPYDRWAEAYTDGPLNAYYRPNMNNGQEIILPVDECGDTLVYLSDIEACLDADDCRAALRKLVNQHIVPYLEDWED